MNTKKHFYDYKITCGILPVLYALCSINSAMSAVRIGNDSRSYANDYKQIADMQAAAATVQYDTSALPVNVPNTDLANSILNGTSENVTRADLDACSMVYPTGSFAWDKPNAGNTRSIDPKCVAVVEMGLLNGTEVIVVASAKIAAGDSIECNISKFPTSGYTASAGQVVFPADNEPTIEDVKRVMDAEQKKNAGLKIAAGILVGGLAGNAAGANDAGNDNVLGKDKGKLKGTAVGALSGAALMAGSSYGGKVGGDVILSTGVNAAAGAVIGNMAQVGDSRLYIKDCKIGDKQTQCLYGILEGYKSIDFTKESAYYDKDTGNIIICDSDNVCNPERLIGVELDNDGNNGYSDIATGKADNNFAKITANRLYTLTKNDNKSTFGEYTGANAWIKITAGGRPLQRVNAMVEISGGLDKKLGAKMDDWKEWKNSPAGKNAVILGRTNDGRVSDILPEKSDKSVWTIKDFYPITIDAEDGKMIDMSNQARLKGTTVGAAAGAGLGAFTAYQGAQDEITQRWTSAVTEYKDSLQKVYCATGTRFLSSYNDTVIIPNVK